MHVHLVFVAKYRRKIFDLDAIENRRSNFASVCADFDVDWLRWTASATMCICGLTARQNSQYRIWSTVLKAYPAGYFAVTGQILHGVHYYKDILWTQGYFASS